MGLWKWLTESPDERSARRREEARNKPPPVYEATAHPDDWPHGYGVNWDWGNPKRTGKHK